MARRRQQVLDRRPARSITAAATRLDPKDREKARREARKRPFDWQRVAFQHYDDVGEARFAANWMGNALSRLRLVPMWQPEPGAIPVAVDSADDATQHGVDEGERMAAVQTLARIGANEGGEGEIMRGAGINVFVAGEFYLIGYQDDDSPGAEETWGVYSVEALQVDSEGKYAIKPLPTSKRSEFIVMPDDAFVLRVGRRHPRYPDWPDSAMKGALDYCEDLRVLTMMIRAAASSRVPSKILGIPQEATFGTPGPDVADEDGDEDDPLTRDLIAHMTTPLSDPRSAASLVPFILRLAKADLEAVEVFDLTREIDRLAIELREETRRAFAASVDLPEGIVTGTQDLNHWTRASVTEEAYTIHVEPYATGIVDAFTFGYYRPGLADLVEDPRRWSIGVDPSGLVSSPDQSKDVQDAYDRIEVSGSYYREVRGIPEDAAPDDVEIERRRDLATISGRARGTPTVPDGDVAGDTEPTTTGPAAVAAGVRPPVLALHAAAADPVDRLGVDLARAEMALRERLRVIADEALHRALERAGNRLRTATQGTALRQVVDGQPAHLVASLLGESVVASMGVDVDDLLRDAWTRVGDQARRLISQAQRDAMHRAMSLGGQAAHTDDRGSLTAAGIATHQESARENREAGVTVLLAALASLAATRLFSPTAPTPEPGEHDDTMLVPPSLVRRALRAAGGGPDVADAVAPGRSMSGLLSGQWLTDLMADQAGVVFGEGYVWLYGDAGSRTTPFEGHEQLDEVEFATWDDPVLAPLPGDEWVGDRYEPDDHPGCQCEVARQGRRDRPLVRSAANRATAGV